MTNDRQLSGITLRNILVKRQLDQALNVKEFAVAAGISYSSAREWFRSPGFPVINGVVFWSDFIQWRRALTRLVDVKQPPIPDQRNGDHTAAKACEKFPARAARVLIEAG